MRAPSEYISAAVRGIRDRMMSGCSAVLRHGVDSAKVTRIGTVSRGEDAVSESGPIEAVRILALAADFSVIAKDDAVFLDEEMHLVTSVRVDPSGTSMTVGMSDALTRYAASVHGKRSGRFISMPIEVLAKDNGPRTEYADGFAPVMVRDWSIAIPRDGWLDVTQPQIGDELRINDNKLRISKVDARDGYFMIAARSRE